MAELTELTIASARNLLANGELSSRELTQDHVSAVSKAGVLNAIITVSYTHLTLPTNIEV